MKIFFLFILIGLLYGASAEVVNQIYVNHSSRGFFWAVVSYAVFLSVLYFVRILYNRIFGKGVLSNIVWFLLFGCIGLCIEWNFLGKKDVLWYGQIAMFTFWSTLAFMPVLFTEEVVFSNLLRRLKIYSGIWIPLYLLVGLVNGGLGLFIWIWGTIALNYFYVTYFWLLKTEVY
jgi:hypothetical protein